jgi:drug/metabolite transporter (DMT)-like permease
MQGWLAVIYIVIFPSLIAQAFYIRAVDLIGANRAGLFINLLPVWGALLAVAILGEGFRLYHAIALIMILAGIGLAEYGGRRLGRRE